jgi:hypothetical protein
MFNLSRALCLEVREVPVRQLLHLTRDITEDGQHGVPIH